MAIIAGLNKILQKEKASECMYILDLFKQVHPHFTSAKLVALENF